MTSTVKVVLSVLVVGAVVVIGGVVYIGHKVAAGITAQMGSSSSLGSRNGVQGDDCRYLSKADVSVAIGIPIVDVRSDSNGCHYYAHGTVDSFGAKHTAFPLKDNPQLVAAILAGKPDAAGDLASPETTSVLDVEVWNHGGESQFNTESTMIAFRKRDAPPQPGLEGIGDNAFTIGNNAMIAHKGDSFINITYSNCPCSTEQIIPLAKKLSAAL